MRRYWGDKNVWRNYVWGWVRTQIKLEDFLENKKRLMREGKRGNLSKIIYLATGIKLTADIANYISTGSLPTSTRDLIFYGSGLLNMLITEMTVYIMKHIKWESKKTLIQTTTLKNDANIRKY